MVGHHYHTIIVSQNHAQMKIERIYYRRNLSLRAYNVCRENGFVSIADLRKYYKEHGDFLGLSKVGRRTNDELIEFTKKYSDKIKVEKEDELIQNDFLSIVGKLNDPEVELVNHFITDRKNQLKNRSRNALSEYLKEDFRITNLASGLIMQPTSKLRNIPNVGSFTLIEIREFIVDIKNYVYQVDANTDRLIVAQKNTALFIQSCFPVKYIPPEVLEPGSIFKILDFLIANDYFLTKNDNKVFKWKYRIYSDSESFTNEDIAAKIGVTKERIRQINMRLNDRLKANLVFVEKVGDRLMASFTSDSNYYCLSNADTLAINQRAETNFSKAFITFMIGLIRQGDFDTIGDLDDVLGNRGYDVRQRHVWKDIYLVNKKLSGIIDFEGLIDEIDRKANKRIEKSHTHQIEVYIKKFTRKGAVVNHLPSIVDVLREMLKREMEINIADDNKIELRRNSYKRIDEYAYEILEEIGEPTSAEDITEKVNQVFTDRDISVTSMRVLMTAEKGFVFMGKEGVYGLKKWESERDDFKGGTIRSITAEYLRKHNEPRLIDDIVNHVLIYRPSSNKESIAQNLRMERHGKFLFYEGNRVGLSEKNYDVNYRKKT